jgi:hypothetical protein
MSGYNSSKRSNKISGKMLGTARVATRVRHRVTRSGTTQVRFWVASRVRRWAQSRIRVWVSVRLKTCVRRPGKTKRARQGDFFASGTIRVEGGDLKESEPRSPSQEEDQRIRFMFKDRIKEEIDPR